MKRETKTPNQSLINLYLACVVDAEEGDDNEEEEDEIRGRPTPAQTCNKKISLKKWKKKARRIKIKNMKTASTKFKENSDY